MQEQFDSLKDEGTFAGLLGAATVAIWFLILDVMAGAPLRTPSVLGQVLLLGRDRPDVVNVDFAGVILYSAFHVAVFLIFGLALSRLLRWAESDSVVRYALLQVFLVFEVFFVALLWMYNETTRMLFPIWKTLVANTLAALVMGWYLWKHHPALRAAIKKVPLGAAPV